MQHRSLVNEANKPQSYIYHVVSVGINYIRKLDLMSRIKENAFENCGLGKMVRTIKCLVHCFRKLKLECKGKSRQNPRSSIPAGYGRIQKMESLSEKEENRRKMKMEKKVETKVKKCGISCGFNNFLYGRPPLAVTQHGAEIVEGNKQKPASPDGYIQVSWLSDSAKEKIDISFFFLSSI